MEWWSDGVAEGCSVFRRNFVESFVGFRGWESTKDATKEGRQVLWGGLGFHGISVFAF